MSDIEPNGADKPRGISRRTVTKAMAWAVPVVAVAAAAPAYAASQGTLNFSGLGCKLPGNSTSQYKGNVFKLSASNTTDTDYVVTILSATLNGSSLGGVALINLQTCTLVTSPFTIAHDTVYPELALVTVQAPNSQNGTLVVTYTVNGGAVQTVTATVPAVPPVTGSGGGSCPTTTFTSAQKTCIVNAIL